MTANTHTDTTGPRQLAVCTLRFPELRVAQRQAHYLRGYFGNLFRDHSPLLHNHYAEGGLRYGYPLVQYKVIAGVPTLIGIKEGSQLLMELFLQVRELQLNGQTYTVPAKDIRQHTYPVGVNANGLQTYRFVSPWLGLNSHNHAAYLRANAHQQAELLKKVLTGNILSFYKGTGLRLNPDERILLTANLQPVNVRFKNQPMTAFTGTFTTNALLPPAIGLGKAVSRGFGCLLLQ